MPRVSDEVLEEQAQSFGFMTNAMACELIAARAVIDKVRAHDKYGGIWYAVQDALRNYDEIVMDRDPPTVRYDSDGAASTDSKFAVKHVLKSREAGDERCRPPPASPTFAEALEQEAHDPVSTYHDGVVRKADLLRMIQRARRASEGS